MLAVWIASNGLLVLILVRAVKNRMLRAYWVFYGYLGFVLAVSLVRMALALTFGTGSSYYYYAYSLPTFLMPLLQVWILWEIYGRLIGYTESSWRSSFRAMMIVGVLTMPIAWYVFSVPLKRDILFYRYHTLTLFVQMTLCLLVCREAVRAREKIDLGQNLKGILSGISLMVGCQAINFIGFIFAQSPSQFFWFFLQFIYFLALIVFTYALWDYAPIYRPDLSYEVRLEKANRQLYKIAKSVLMNRTKKGFVENKKQ